MSLTYNLCSSPSTVRTEIAQWYSAGLQAGWSGIFHFTTASRPALGPTQPPIQRVPVALTLGVKLPGR